MSLIEEAREAMARRGPLCTVARFIAHLAPKDAAEVEAALGEPHDVVPTTGLYAAMDARGWNPPKAATLNRHRRGECSCG